MSINTITKGEYNAVVLYFFDDHYLCIKFGGKVIATSEGMECSKCHPKQYKESIKE